MLFLVGVAHAEEAPAPEGKRYISSDASGLEILECHDDGHGGQVCGRCETQDGKDVCTLPLTAKDVEILAKQGVTPSNPPVAAAPPPPPPASPPAREPRPIEPYHHALRGVSFALELGAMNVGDGNNIYSSGLGRGWMLGYWIFEVRVESYDLGDQTKTYDNVANASGRAGIYSAVARPTLFTAGPIELVGTVGLAVLSRPSLRTDPDDVDADISHLREQWGGGLVVGGGVRIYDLITVDVRAYPTAWSGISGTRSEADATGKLVQMPIGDSPGGVPISINAGIGLAF